METNRAPLKLGASETLRAPLLPLLSPPHAAGLHHRIEVLFRLTLRATTGVARLGDIYLYTIHFSHTSTFQVLDKPWSQVGVVPFSPLVFAYKFYRA